MTTQALRLKPDLTTQQPRRRDPHARVAERHAAGRQS
jgi:hypothetical protein